MKTVEEIILEIERSVNSCLITRENTSMIKELRRLLDWIKSEKEE